jgi:hypothetical protein
MSEGNGGNIMDVQLLHGLVQKYSPSSEDLIKHLKEAGVDATEQDLITHALEAGIGLLFDNRWYTHEQSSLVRESRRNNHLTYVTEKREQELPFASPF